MRRGLVQTVLAIALLASPLPVAEAAEAAKLSARDRADIARVETYLNNLRTVRADFIQTSTDGGIAKGKFYLSRPGKLRLDYAPPAKFQIFADGFWLIYVDNELGEANHIPLSSTPAQVLVAEHVRLSGDVTVTRVQRRFHTLRIHMFQTEQPDAGSLALIFADNPLALHQWVVTDSQGISTRVSLVNPEFNITLDNRLFVVDLPDSFSTD